VAERPLLLVDVDGVLSLFGTGVDHDVCLPTLVDGMPHFLSRPAATALTRLANRFECVWCTGWEDRAESHLPQLLGLPGGWHHLVFTDPPETEAHWKLRAIDDFAGRDRPLAWIDDAHDDRCHAWAAARRGPTLLVSTDPAVGLTEADADRLERWLRRRERSPRPPGAAAA
jgi:HAD domain in Swiss Army Knife RNA repair proteins